MCRGNIMAGRPGSNPSRGNYSMRLDRGTGLTRVFIPPGQYIGTSLAEHINKHYGGH